MPLPFQEAVAFDRQRDAVDFEYNTNIATNASAKSQLDLDEAGAAYRLNKTIGRSRQQLPGQFAGRGLLNSGFYKQGLEDFSTDRVDAISKLRNDFGRQRTDLFSQIGAFDANRMIRMADIDLNAATRRSAIASVLQGVG